jgi:hypothetical protein
MNVSTPVLVEEAVQIAWDYLERTGQIDDPKIVSEFLFASIKHMALNGESRRLALSNLAIMAYEHWRRHELAA